MLDEKPSLGEWLRQKQEEPMPRTKRSERARGFLVAGKFLLMLLLPVWTFMVYEGLAFYISPPSLQRITSVPYAMDTEETGSGRRRTTWQYVKINEVPKGHIVFLCVSKFGYREIANAMLSRKPITFEYYEKDCERGQCKPTRAFVGERLIFDEAHETDAKLTMASIFWVLGMLALILHIRAIRKLRKPQIVDPIIRR